MCILIQRNKESINNDLKQHEDALKAISYFNRYWRQLKASSLERSKVKIFRSKRIKGIIYPNLHLILEM